MEEMQIHRQSDRHRRRYQMKKTTIKGIVHSTPTPSYKHKDHTEDHNKNI